MGPLFAAWLDLRFRGYRGRGSDRAARQFPDHEAGGQFGGRQNADLTSGLDNTFGRYARIAREIGTDAPIRISVGIENVEDSISEIAQGLERVTRRQKPWARKPCFSAGDECFRRGNAGDHVGQSDVAARCYVARWPFAVPEVAACFDCAVAVDGSLEMRVHPRRDRGEPCAPKAEFGPGLLGSRLERRQGRPYQQSCGRREGAGYLGASGRASVRALLAVKRRSPSRRRRLGLR